MAYVGNINNNGFVLTSNGMSIAPSFQIGGSGGIGTFTWIDQISTIAPMIPGNGYVVDCGSTRVTFILPLIAAFGATVVVVGSSAGGWIITQNVSQVIHFGANQTSAGINGYLESGNQGDCVELICVQSSSQWVVRRSIGGSLIGF